ncbi:MAG: WbuC family cupin fold metalloprotein [Nanoarchaeota archaeon]
MKLKKISEEELNELFQKSKISKRKRIMKVFQDDSYKGVHVCLNIIQPDSYMQPHLRYKDEIILYHSGRLCSLWFDKEGNITEKNYLNKDSPFLFLPKKTFHTIVSLEENSSIWLILKGPHNPNNFSEYLKNTPNENEDYYNYFKSLKEQSTNHI